MKSKILTATAMSMLALVFSLVLTVQGQEDSHSSAPRRYTVTVLPGLGGLSGAFSVNNQTWVAGISNPPGDAFEHAFVWHGGESTDLGTLGGYNSSVPFPNKNDTGWLVGPSETADADPYQENFCRFICTGKQCLPFNQICKGFLWRSELNDMIALPPLSGGNNSYGAGANNQGQIVGVAENGVQDPNCVAPQVFRFEGVVWRVALDGTPFVSQELAPLAGDTASAGIQINQHGDVAGTSGPCVPLGSGAVSHALLWRKGHAIDLGNLGGTMNNAAFALNNKGQVVGTSDLPGDSATHTFLWQRGAMADLGTLRPDDFFTLPNSINDQGEIVGLSCGPVDCHGFIWSQGVMRDLNSYLPAGSPLLITTAGDINSAEEIAIQAWDATVQDFVAAVLVPDNDNRQANNGQGAGENGMVAQPYVSAVHGTVVVPQSMREQP